MKMKVFVIFTFILILIIVFSFAYISMIKNPSFTPPNIEIANSKVSIKGFTNSSLDIILEIRNPNKVPVIVTKIRYVLYGNDNVAICQGNITKQIIIGPNAVKYIPIRVRMRYATQKVVWDAMEMDKIEWRVAGQIYIRVNNKDIVVSFRS